MTKPRVAFALRTPELRDELFDRDLLDRLLRVADIDCDRLIDLRDVTGHSSMAATEVLVTGWGTPRIGADVIDRMPALRAVIHAAGSIKKLIDPAAWERGIRVSTAATANARSVAEYTVAMILLAGKRVFDVARRYRESEGSAGVAFPPDIGNYGKVVGIVGGSRTGRQVIELLAPYDLEVLLYDPLLSDEEVRLLGVRPASLHTLLSLSSVITLHAPALPETRQMIGARELALMADGATLINTARGALVDHDALMAELRRDRLTAILDVVDPEPLPAQHPLLGMPQVFVTPHVAGSLGNELRRLGRSVVEEIERYAIGKQFAHEVRRSDLSVIA